MKLIIDNITYPVRLFEHKDDRIVIKTNKNVDIDDLTAAVVGATEIKYTTDNDEVIAIYSNELYIFKTLFNQNSYYEFVFLKKDPTVEDRLDAIEATSLDTQEALAELYEEVQELKP